MSWQEELETDFGLNAAQTASFERLLELAGSDTAHSGTRISTPGRIVDLHFRDSLSLLAFPELRQADTVIDIGSGAGFPGLPLAIALPETRFELLEANGRKCAFISDAAADLGLENITATCARAEDAARTGLRESYDVALARAVGSLELVLEYAMPFLRPGGTALLQRGRRQDGDSDTAAAVAGLLGGKLDRVTPVEPYAEAKHLHIWVFHKTGTTPDRFPRRAGVARKRPLKP